MIQPMSRWMLVAYLFGGVAACGETGGEEAHSGGQVPPVEQSASQSAAPRSDAAQPPVNDVVDPKLADRGEETFKVRGCVACHTIGGGRLVGPDLKGVTDRREPGWIRAMVLNPDSMIKNDPAAKELFATYMTPMANQQVKQDEVDALIAYLRRESESESGS